MERLISKYGFFLPYIIVFSQIFKFGGITHYGIILLHLCNIFVIFTNIKFVFKDKLQIISLIYIGITILYQVITPPLSEIYNPYVKDFYYVFIETGMSFWIIGYKGYDLLNKYALNIIYWFVFILLIVGYYIIYLTGDISLLDAELWDYTYQLLPYLFLWLTSVFYLYKSNKRILLIILFILVIILSTKRGPLVSFFFGIIITNILLKNKFDMKRILYIGLGSIVLCYVLYNNFYDFLENWINRWTEQEDISNGRDDIWMIIWNDMENKDFFTWIFGNGFEATHIITYRNLWGAIGAHNDYLDILYNMGMLGEGIFISLILRWMLVIRHAIKCNFQYTNMMIYLLVCFIIGSYVSSNLTRFATVFFALYFYYFAGCLARKTSKLKI